MTPEEINAAIAKSQGFFFVKESTDPFTSVYSCVPFKNGGKFLGFLEHGPSPFPNYYGSLDAIVPVVRAMETGEMAQVIMQLYHINPITPVFNCYVATPAQWCEAYLKARNLWR
jgi:hypothetical protein